MRLYHYLHSQGILKRQNGRVPGALTVSVIDCRDGLYLLLFARRYAKAIPFGQGDNLLLLIAEHSFRTLRVVNASVHFMTGDHQTIADQVAGFYFNHSQEEL
jgi:hypothetical protein